LLGKETQSFVRKAEQIDNPDKNNVEKNSCLKLAHVLTTKVGNSKESIELLMQGLFVRM